MRRPIVDFRVYKRYLCVETEGALEGLGFCYAITGKCQWSHVSLLSEVREVSPFGRWELISQIP